MRQVGGRPDHRARFRLEPVVSHREPGSARHHVVELVRAGVHVGRLALPGLEAVEADEEAVAPEQVGFGAFAGLKGDEVGESADLTIHGAVIPSEARDLLKGSGARGQDPSLRSG